MAEHDMTQPHGNRKEAAVKPDKLQCRGKLFPSDTPLQIISKRKEMVSCSCSRLESEVLSDSVDHEVVTLEGLIEARTAIFLIVDIYKVPVH